MTTREQETLNTILSQVKDVSRDFSTVYGGLIRNVYQLGDEVTKLSGDLKKAVGEIYLLEEGGFIYTHVKRFSDQMEESSQFFAKAYGQDFSYANQINGEIESLANLNDTVKLMNETSVDMEIISINTLTVAVRAGKVGGAFSYITNEIKKLTQSMSSQAELLGNRTEAIRTALDLYEDKLQIIIKQEQEIKEILSSSLPKNLAGGLDRIKELYIRYMDIWKDFKKIDSFINSMVERLQFQDTIAQALDNMSTVLIRYIIERTEPENPAREDQLDYLLLKERVYKTSETIMNDLKHRSAENLEGFRVSIHEMQSFLKEVGRKKVDVDKSVADHGFFRGALEEVRDLSTWLTSCASLKQDFSKGSSNQIKSVLGLRQIFDGISLIINRFENISIASKIEVAKQKGLKDMEGNIREMTNLISTISADLNSGNEIISGFIGAIEKILSAYFQDFLKEEKFYKHFQEEVSHLLSKSSRHFDRVEPLLHNFVLSSSFMDGYFHSMDSHVGESKGLTARVEELNYTFSGLYLEAKADLERALREQNLTSWEFSSSDYTEALNHFKIYSYKMAMKENLGRQVVQDSVDEGDVILF